MVQVGVEAVGLLLDDLQGGGQFAVALAAVAVAGLAEIVERVEIHARQFAHRGAEVAGHREVQHEQRPAVPPGLDRGERLAGDDRLGRPGGADHQVGRGEGRVEFVPRRRPAVPTPGDLLGPLGAAVEHRQLLRPLVGEVAEGLLGHLAGPDHQHLLVVEPLENLLGEVGHRHAGNAHAALLDARLPGDPAGGLQGGLERRVGQRAGRRFLGGRLVRLLHLGEDLRLAEHHAVEARRHLEQVPHGRAVGLLVQAPFNFALVEPVELGEEPRDLGARRHRAVLGRRIQLDPVAGRQQHRLDLGVAAAELGQGGAGLGVAKRQSLPHRHLGGVMAATDNLELHGLAPEVRTGNRSRAAGDWLIFRPVASSVWHTPKGRKMCLSPCGRTPRSAPCCV